MTKKRSMGFYIGFFVGICFCMFITLVTIYFIDTDKISKGIKEVNNYNSELFEELKGNGNNKSAKSGNEAGKENEGGDEEADKNKDADEDEDADEDDKDEGEGNEDADQEK